MNYQERIFHLLTEEKRDPATSRSSKWLKGGQDRGKFGTPSRLEKALGVYVPTKGKTSALKKGLRGVTYNIGAGVAGTQTRKRHGREEPDPGSGFTRIRPEDSATNPDTHVPPSTFQHLLRRHRVRTRKGQESGDVRSGGLKRLRRKIRSKTYAADRAQLQGAISKKQASGNRRLKRGFSNLPKEE